MLHLCFWFMLPIRLKCFLSLVYESLANRRGSVMTMMVCSLLAMVIEKSFAPFLMREFINNLSVTHDKGAPLAILVVYKSALAVFAAYAIAELCYRCGSILLSILCPLLQSNVRERLYRHIMMHSMSFFNKNPIGDLSSQIYDLVGNTGYIFRQTMETILPIIVSVIVAVIVMFPVSVKVGLVLTTYVALHFITIYVMYIRSTKLSGEHASAANTLQGHIVDTILNIVHVRLFNNYRTELKNFDRYKKTEEEKHWRSLWYLEKTKLILCAIMLAGYIIAGLVAIQEWRDSKLMVGDVAFVFQSIWVLALLLWWGTLESVGIVRVLGRSLEEIKVLSTPNVSSSSGNELIVEGGAIDIENLSFAYSSNRPLFKSINCKIKAGSKVAIVGLSGSGKTTLVNLILRSYDPQQGSIKIDGQDISNISLESLYQNFAVVPQNVTLFNRSIMENIVYGKPSATKEQVIEAAKLACCHDFIEEIPENYDAVVTEDILLSQGQKQRILIARAILKNAPIVILDEITSALDTVTENKVRAAISHLVKNKTTLIIAHRMSTISMVDEVLLMCKGEIVDFGTNNELRERSALYRELWSQYLVT